MSDIDLTQWIRNSGGGCPVGNDEKVEWLMQDGRELGLDTPLPADHLEWGSGILAGYRLANVTDLRPGDYVALEGLTDQQYRHMLDAFLAAGAYDFDGANPNIGNKYDTLYWDGSNDVWVSPRHDCLQDGKRQLTYQQVMDIAGQCKPEDFDDAVAPENGHGLPPVGFRVEAYITNRDTWTEVEIKAHSDGLALFKNGNDGIYQGYPASDFRPLRSEEDKAVEEMLGICRDKMMVSSRQAMVDLYRAGYRKTEAPQ